MPEENTDRTAARIEALFQGRSFAQPPVLWSATSAAAPITDRRTIAHDLLRSLKLIDLGPSNHESHLWPDDHRSIGLLNPGSGYVGVGHVKSNLQPLFLASPALFGACADALALMEDLDAEAGEPAGGRWAEVKAALETAMAHASGRDG